MTPTAEQLPKEDETPRILNRPDGYHWVSADGHDEYGPFETWAAASADMEAADEAVPTDGETLQEAESDIGQADWIDPATGDPAEGQCPPHLDES
jgi:hypothetical protein